MSDQGKLKILSARHAAPEPPGADSAPEEDVLRDHEDWTVFRNPETLGQRAGVPRQRLPEAIAKEVADNALDHLERHRMSAIHCRLGLLEGEGGFYVENGGPPLPGTDDQIAALFSINRPYRSSKHVRTVTRGMLGNGLRVVAGAVLCSGPGGHLVVETGGRILRLEPQHADGSTHVRRLGPSDRAGTRIEVHLGPELPFGAGDLSLARMALAAARCPGAEAYKGKTSAYWYSADMFYELLHSAPAGQTVRQFVEGFDGCAGAKAGRISQAWHDRYARTLTQAEAALLQADIKAATAPVKPARLGRVGPDYLPGAGYARTEGYTGTMRTGRIPYVIEAWLKTTEKKPAPQKQDPIGCVLLVNKTPVLSKFYGFARGPGKLSLFGGGLSRAFTVGGRRTPAHVVLAIQTPAIAMTSDGKEPDLIEYGDAFADVLAKAAKAAQAALPTQRSEKEILYEVLPELMRVRSGDGQHTVQQRGLYYSFRPIVLKELGKEPDWNHFTRILGDYENDRGRLAGLVRDNRGTLYIPHEKITVPLGTVSVANFKRPAWTFNKVLYIEKEGLFSLLIAEGWPEKHDCALMTSKGFTTRAVKDLIDLLGEDGEPITVYCMHDADAAGTLIYQSLVEQTRAREARRVHVVNLGLEPWEALAKPLQLTGEAVTARSDGHKRGVAEYVREYDRTHGTQWEEELQKRRYELDEMVSTEDFLNWVEAKFAGTSKVMPPPEVLEEEHLQNEIERITEEIREEALRAYGYDEKVAAAEKALREDEARRAKNRALLPERLELGYKRDPKRSWRTVLKGLRYKISRLKGR